ncbi:MAG: hypothetical protein H0U51_08310, partial [Propionibacteriales bacterium]|nr:hypothetical protein [Propionibacteriales bacterium]
GAKVFMADFEDSNTPTFSNLVLGQINLRDAWLRQIDFTSPQGKTYALADQVATVMVRNRGWHLPERHVLVDGVTEIGVRNNVSVGIQYLESWLRGGGAVAIFNLMEDAATAEISRSQIWQRVHNDATTAEGIAITPEWVRSVEDEELDKIRAVVGEDVFGAGKYDEAHQLFEQVALADDFVEFLTLPAYERLAE